MPKLPLITNWQMQDNKLTEPTITFHYSSQVIYYLTWFGGSIIFIFVIIPVALLFFKLIGVNMDRNYIAPFWLEHQTIWWIVFLFIVILIAASIFLIPFFLALKITNSKGIASFYKDMVVFDLGFKHYKLFYNEVDKVIMTIVSSFNTKGPPLYRLRIEFKDKRKRRLIQGAFNEAWVCRRKGEKPLIYAVGELLAQKCSCKMEIKHNSWG